MPFKREYSEKILSGEKTIELRRMIFSQDVSHIVIYETAPKKRVVGYFKVGDVENLTVEEIWDKYRDRIGISRSFLEEYFSGKEFGFAIFVEEPKRFRYELTLEDVFKYSTRAPQNFRYLDDAIADRLV